MRRALLTCLAAAACTLTGAACAAPTTADVDPGETFEALYERDLSAFERQIAMEERHERGDAWTEVGRAWLDLVNCTGLERLDDGADRLDEPAGDEPLAAFMYATVVLEMRRRNARAFGAEADGAPKLWHDLERHDFFAREPKPLPDHLIRWPGEDESWVDEGMATVEVDSECADLRTNLYNQLDDDEKEDFSPDDERRRWQRAQLEAVEQMVALEEELGEARELPNIRLLMWRARVHGAHLALLLDDAERGLALIEAIENEVHEDETSDVDQTEQANMRFLRGRLLADLDKADAALDDLERALADGLPSPNADRARYLTLKLLTDQGRFDDAIDAGAPLPAPTSPLFEPFAYRLALAARQTGDDKRFFAIATNALSAAPRTASPFQRAIYAQALDLLAGYEFDRRVVELAENLGPKNKLFERLTELAHTSLKRGFPANAAAQASWLLRHHHNHRFKARYHRIMAVAAFMQDDEPGFRKNVHAMTRRSEDVVQAVGEARQAQFFADADRAFARLMGQMLPAMADWGEDPGAERRRQKWLTITVEETQTFLRSVERSEVQGELLDLYKLASNLLEEHPRGYAERLGTKEPAPLVLGTVQVGHGELVDGEPRVEPRLAAPFFLSLVPRAGRAPSQWTFGWPDDQPSDHTDSPKAAEVAHD